MNDKASVSGFPEPVVGETITSVVAASQKKNSLMIAAFLAFMALFAMVVCHKPRPKTPQPLPDKDVSTGPSLPPPMVYPRPSLPIEAIMSRSPYQPSGEAALLDVRRKSPIVIFNKASSSGGGSGGAPGGMNMEMAALSPLGVMQSGQNRGDGGLGVPLPANYTPTTGMTARATEMGDRESTITQGKLIDAVLETAINSDHPGMLRAIISHDVYGDTGRAVLLPRGSRLIGQYDSAIAKGQNRVFVIWERAIRPDGIDIQLGSAGTDPLGRTGVEGDVNNHFFTMFGAATLLSIIGATASVLSVNASDQNNSLAQYRESVTNGFSNAAGTVLGQFVQIKPTITVKPGVQIKVFVARDLYFDPALSSANQVQYIQ
jgi:type IV secretion system protein VirB10